jgi:hypothetical protein
MSRIRGALVSFNQLAIISLGLAAIPALLPSRSQAEGETWALAAGAVGHNQHRQQTREREREP